MPDQPSRALIPPAARPLWTSLADALAVHGPVPCETAEDVDVWWRVDTPEDAAVAAVRCASCPVGAECAAYAIAAGERHGIWGGTLPAERRALTRRAAA